MRILKRILRQRAVYWAPKKNKGRFGDEQFEIPVEIKCRWEDSKYKGISGNMTEVIFKSFIYSGTQLKEGGKLWKDDSKHPLANLKSLKNEEGKITPPDDAGEIRSYEEFPVMKGSRQVLRIAKL